MLYCQNPQVPMSMSRCCACDKLETCKRFKSWYAIHHEEYASFVIKQVEKYPKKYQIRSRIMSQKRVTPRQVIIIDPKTSECEVMPHSELSKLSVTQIKALAGKKIIELEAKDYQYVISIKTKQWDREIKPNRSNINNDKHKNLKELIKPVKGYEGIYLISNYGYVISVAGQWIGHNGTRQTKKRSIILKPTINENGYKTNTLFMNGKHKIYRTALLVWNHFGSRKYNAAIYQIDHIDNNPPNNRIDNLQLLTPRENVTKAWLRKQSKSSRYTGVSCHHGKWRAHIFYDSRLVSLGTFIKEEDAAAEYKRALKELIETGSVTVNSPLMKRKKSKCRGVNWLKERRKWQAQIMVNYKRKTLGYFDKEEDACNVYNRAKIESRNRSL
ncbi:MAG: HNH endonuclease [Candidatus Tenebribacter davisii]|nr:HNH endonuclease [Candidatus Tenebribacter davisii]